MRLTKEQKDMLRSEFTKVWHDDTKMIDYCTKKTSAFVTTDEGYIITFDQPRIQTRFCFGYGYQGAYDSQEEAADAAASARASETRFVVTNLNDTDAHSIMDGIAEDDYELWLSEGAYNTQDDDCKFRHIVWKRKHGYDPYKHMYKVERMLTDEEVKSIYAVAYEEQVKFLKRLKTYLKRYGTSKLHTWTYWADE